MRGETVRLREGKGAEANRAIRVIIVHMARKISALEIKENVRLHEITEKARVEELEILYGCVLLP